MNLAGSVRLNKPGVVILCITIVLFVLYMVPRNDEIGIIVEKVNLKNLLLVSIEVAEQGGVEVVKVIKEANLHKESKGKTKEDADIPVTNADYRSHCVMYYGISKTFSSIKVISEEKAGEKECQELSPIAIETLDKKFSIHDLPDYEIDSEHVSVWIDPLDATKEYTEGLYDYVTTMVCVAVQGNPVIGVIHKPFAPEPKTSWIWLNKASSSNLKDNQNKDESKSVIISKSHPGDVEKLVKDVFGPETKIIQAGGAGYKALEVAHGNVTAYIHKTEISKWDICAGDAIITGLRGRLTSLDGEDLDYSATASHVNKNGILAMMAGQESYLDKLKLLRRPPH